MYCAYKQLLFIRTIHTFINNYYIINTYQYQVILGDGVVDAVRGGGQTIYVLLSVETQAGLRVNSSLANVTMLTYGGYLIILPHSWKRWD